MIHFFGDPIIELLSEMM